MVNASRFIRILSAVIFLVALPLIRCSGDMKAEAPTAVIDGYGILVPVSEQERRKNPDTPTKDEIVIPTMVVSKQTDQIPAQMGIGFGIKVTVFNLPADQQIRIRKIVRYPAMHLPDGTVSRSFSTDIGPITIKKGQAMPLTEGYAFTESYEMVTGDWTIELWYGSQKLAEKTFHIFGV